MLGVAQMVAMLINLRMVRIIPFAIDFERPCRDAIHRIDDHTYALAREVRRHARSYHRQRSRCRSDDPFEGELGDDRVEREWRMRSEVTRAERTLLVADVPYEENGSPGAGTRHSTRDGDEGHRARSVVVGSILDRIRGRLR